MNPRSFACEAVILPTGPPNIYNLFIIYVHKIPKFSSFREETEINDKTAARTLANFDVKTVYVCT